MTTPREPPSAARIAEIRAGIIAQGDRASIADLLAALDYCRDAMVEAAAVAVHDDQRATDTLVNCLYRLFPEEPL